MSIDPAAPNVAKLAEGWPLYPGRSPEVLHVEDNEDNRLVYSMMFRRFGMVVHEAVGGYEGLEMAMRLRPDLAVLDISIPGIDGWEVARRLRADPDLQSIPLMGLSARALGRDVEFARSLGFDDYLCKPAEPKRAAVAAWKCIVVGWQRGYRAGRPAGAADGAA